jgi:hypothetical protein
MMRVLPRQAGCSGAPSSRISPLLADSSPATRRSSVLLPQPLRPTMATNSPGAMCSCLGAARSRWP